MKKNVIFLLLLLILFSFCACVKNSQTDESLNNTDIEYSGFSNIPEYYTPQTAEKDGCFVIVSGTENSSKTEVFGKNQWQAFFDSSNNGSDSFLRVAHFIGNEGYYTDLYYQKNKYYQYKKDEYGIRQTGPYNYLRVLAGKDGIPQKESKFYVLTDSLELTYEDVAHSMYSSNIESITKIPFIWLGFTVYLNNSFNTPSMSKNDMIQMAESITKVPAGISLSSNPYDYINANIETFNTLVELGQPVVDCFVEVLRTSDTFGLDKYIMAAVCSEITGIGSKQNMSEEYDADTWWASANEWLALYEKRLR